MNTLTDRDSPVNSNPLAEPVLWQYFKSAVPARTREDRMFELECGRRAAEKSRP